MENESDGEEMNRRQMLASAMATLVLTPAVSGCIGLLMRVVVGRGLARTLARSAGTSRLSHAAISRASSTLSFGRGVAIGARMVPANLYRSGTGSIIGPQQKLIASFETSASNSLVRVDNSVVFSSQSTRYGFEHFNRNGICGRSFVNRSSREVRHQTDDGHLLAIDRIDTALKLVEHFDPDGRLIGKSRFGVRGSDINVSADDNSIASIEAARAELGLQCPEVKEAYDRMLEAKRLCGENIDNACRSVTDHSLYYERLREQCIVRLP